MKLISEITVTVKKGAFPLFVDHLFKKDCRIQSVALIEEKNGRELYTAQIMYGSISHFKDFLSVLKVGDKFDVRSVTDILEEMTAGGLLKVAARLPIESITDYEINILGASDYIDERINEGAGGKYSGISKSVGLISGVKTGKDFKSSALYPLYRNAETESALISRFSALNAYPLIVHYPFTEDFIKTVGQIRHNFRVLRIQNLDFEDISMYEQLYSDAELPMLIYRYDDLPLYLMTVLIRLLQKHRLNPEETTVGFIGIDISAIRVARLLTRINCRRVLGFDASERSMLGFENQGGLATTKENIFQNADIIVLLKDTFNIQEYQIMRPGMFVVSMLKNTGMESSFFSGRGIREYIPVQRAMLYTMLPGLVSGIIDSGIKAIDDRRMVDLARKFGKLILENYEFPDIFGDVHVLISDLLNSTV